MLCAVHLGDRVLMTLSIQPLPAQLTMIETLSRKASRAAFPQPRDGVGQRGSAI